LEFLGIKRGEDIAQTVMRRRPVAKGPEPAQQVQLFSPKIQAQLEKANQRATASEPEASSAQGVKTSGREGKVHIGAYLHPDFKTGLRLVQAKTGHDIQTLMATALNELFRTHNVPVVDHK
jgi:hypothetical protein